MDRALFGIRSRNLRKSVHRGSFCSCVPHSKETPSRWVLFQICTFARRGNVESVKGRASPTTTGDIESWNWNFLEKLSCVWIVSVHKQNARTVVVPSNTSTTPNGHPKHILGIYGHAIRDTAITRARYNIPFR